MIDAEQIDDFIMGTTETLDRLSGCIVPVPDADAHRSQRIELMKLAQMRRLEEMLFFIGQTLQDIQQRLP